MPLTAAHCKATAVGLSAALHAARRRRWKEKTQDKLKRVLVLFFTVVFTALCTLCMQSFQSINDGRTFFYDPSIEYDAPAHTNVVTVSGVLLVFVLFGQPVAVACFTRRLARRDVLRDPQIRSAYGGLYDSYKDRYVDFEAFSLLRRGLAVVAAVQLREHPWQQALAQVALSLVYGALIYHWRP